MDHFYLPIYDLFGGLLVPLVLQQNLAILDLIPFRSYSRTEILDHIAFFDFRYYSRCMLF